jgi:Bacterial PH domain
VTARETFRLAPPVIFWWVWVAFVALNVIDYAVQGLPSARFGAVLAAILLLVTGLAFTLALRPRVIASDDGITVVNPYRTHFVPWRLVTFVDTAEWVQVHYVPAAGGAGTGEAVAGGGRGYAAARGTGGNGTGASSAGGKTVHCWALYVSARARRKIASGPPRPRDPLSPGLLGLARGRGRLAQDIRGGAGDEPGATPGYASSRVPAEARYLASLPPAKAMAVRLDSRADRERARADGTVGNDTVKDPPRVTAEWSWPALAAVAVPAAFLLVVALA